MGHLEQGPSETEPCVCHSAAWEATSVQSEAEPVSSGPSPLEAAFCLPFRLLLHHSVLVFFQFLECTVFLPVV